MQRALDKELEELNREEALYAAVIKDGDVAVGGMGLGGRGGSSGGGMAVAVAEARAARAVQEENMRVLEEQLEVSGGAGRAFPSLGR